MRKIIFAITIIILFPTLIISKENYEPPIKPYWTEELEKSYVFPEDYFFYNYLMRNYGEAIKLYEEHLINEIKNYYEYVTKIGFIPYYIDALIQIKKYNEAYKACKLWEELSAEYKGFDYNMKPYLYGKRYILFLQGKNEKELKRLESIKCSPQDFFEKLTFFEPIIIKWYVIILDEYLNNENDALKVIDNYDFFILQMQKARILARTDIDKAIEYLKSEQNIFLEEKSPILEYYLTRYEESNLLLSYFYYKVNDKEKAFETFILALTKYSTFTGDFDYWLNYRDYFQDEYDVLLKLKEMYLEQQNNK